MDVRIVCLPKFHCELNPIEIFWAHLINDFRKNNDQSSNAVIINERIKHSRKTFMEKDTNHRL